ncbi:hypothetical protein M1L60_05110 [Actinoplanes sp. TRM 88003]|uniref:Uncharacterized protein n=1 Tax=Paractinoplanes aksuensis TaxID=2939490 RepID=A0ABT1DGP1_9ACTN|nr:hypothetical protein [Actinoplanes aksuensis]MCO8269970.1 hypothetical protein [Actinoplanes aksuensis]
MRVALAAMVAAVLLAVGGVVVWSLRSPVTAVQVSALRGGTVTTDEGVAVRFAPGALSQDTEVRVVPRPSVAAPHGLSWLTEPVDIELGGARLLTSATLRLPLREAATDDLITVVSRGEDGVWSGQGGLVDPTARTITTIVGHLSIVSAGHTRVTAPDFSSGSGAEDAPDPECGTTRSDRWTARAEGEAVKTCVAAGAVDRPALLRVTGNRAYGQFAELGAYPPITVAQPGDTGLADEVWRGVAAADRDHTFLPGQGALDLTLPGNYRTIEFVTRTGPDVAVAEYVVEVMSRAFVPAEVTVQAVRCVLDRPAADPARGDRVLLCVTAALAAERILPENVAGTDEKLAKQDRDGMAQAVLTAIRELPAGVAGRPDDGAGAGWRVTAERSPVIPRKALNEPGGSIPASVVATQEKLYAAALRDALPGALPPPGLVWSNTTLTGRAVTEAVAALVTTPPLRWPCDETARDGYVYGLADPDLLTYPARLSDLGLPPEDVGIVRQTAAGGQNYRLCVALDGTWTALTHDQPAGGFPADEAERIGAMGPGVCRPGLGGAFVPADSTCRTSVRADLDGDGRTDTVLIYERAGTWTARAVLTAGQVFDLTLPYRRDEKPVPVRALDLDGRPGAEVELRSGSTSRLLRFDAGGLALSD